MSRLAEYPACLHDGVMNRRLIAGTLTLCLMALASPSARASPSDFTVTSTAAVGGVLATDATCDGAGISPALAWSHPPKGTKGYAIVMDHLPPEGGHHWYWLDWGIPAKTRNVAAGATNIGYLGGNSVNREIGYTPPCSKGPGEKTYTITVYALSRAPKLPKASTASVTRDALLAAISTITLSKAVLDVTYTR